MVDSVPLLVMRTFSTEGTALQMRRAISTSRGLGMPKLVPDRAVSCTAAMTAGGACPRMAGPHEPT